MKTDNFKLMKQKLVFKAWRASIVLSNVFAILVTLAFCMFMQLLSYFFNNDIFINNLEAFFVVYLAVFTMLLALITPLMFVNMHMNDEQFHDDKGGGE